MLWGKTRLDYTHILEDFFHVPPPRLTVTRLVQVEPLEDAACKVHKIPEYVAQYSRTRKQPYNLRPYHFLRAPFTSVELVIFDYRQCKRRVLIILSAASPAGTLLPKLATRTPLGCS